MVRAAKRHQRRHPPREHGVAVTNPAVPGASASSRSIAAASPWQAGGGQASAGLALHQAPGSARAQVASVAITAMRLRRLSASPGGRQVPRRRTACRDVPLAQRCRWPAAVAVLRTTTISRAPAPARCSMRREHRPGSFRDLAVRRGALRRRVERALRHVGGCAGAAPAERTDPPTPESEDADAGRQGSVR